MAAGDEVRGSVSPPPRRRQGVVSLPRIGLNRSQDFVGDVAVKIALAGFFQGVLLQ